MRIKTFNGHVRQNIKWLFNHRKKFFFSTQIETNNDLKVCVTTPTLDLNKYWFGIMRGKKKTFIFLLFPSVRSCIACDLFPLNYLFHENDSKINIYIFRQPFRNWHVNIPESSRSLTRNIFQSKFKMEFPRILYDFRYSMCLSITIAVRAC